MDVDALNQLQGDLFNDGLNKAIKDELTRPHNKGKLAKLCQVSGHTISYSWLIALLDGRIKQAKNSTLLRVAKYLGVESTPDGKLFNTGKHFNPELPVWDNQPEEQ